jgi:hypothetical protein
MDHRLVGEFMGMLISDLPRRRSQRERAARKVRGREFRLDRHYDGMGIGSNGGSIHRDRLPQPGHSSIPQSRLRWASSPVTSSLLDCAGARSNCRSNARAAPLPPALGPYARCSTKTRLLLHDPSIRNTAANLLSEFLATFVLVLIVPAIFSKAISASGPAAGLGPFLVGAVVWAIDLCLGGMTRFPLIRHAIWRPRIAHSVLPTVGKGDSDWRYAGVPVAGTLLGAALAGVFVKMIF